MCYCYPDTSTAHCCPQFIKNKLVNVFTEHFKAKVTEILNELNLKDNAYNGQPKVVTKIFKFMAELSIGNAPSTIKMENLEGLT